MVLIVAVGLVLIVGLFAGLVVGARLSAAEIREARRLSNLSGPSTICAVCAPVDGPAPTHPEGR